MPAPIIVLTGPPGVGKTTVSSIVADTFSQSAVIEGDSFHRFPRRGKIPPWLPESHQQNTMLTSVSIEAAAGYARDGWTAILEGIFGPWFLPTIRDYATELTLHYFVLKVPLETSVARFVQREPLSATEVVEKMHREFTQAAVESRHVIDADQAPEVVAEILIRRVKDGSGILSPLPGHDPGG